MSKASLPKFAPGRPKLSFGHYVLATPNLAAMAEWYMRVLDAKPMLKKERAIFLSFDECHHRLLLFERPIDPAAPERPQAFDHIAFACEDLAHLVERYETLVSEAIEPVRGTNHGMTTSLYYRDPDGNLIELYVDNFSSAEALEEWLASGVFEENPRGNDFDVAAFIARVQAGAAVIGR